MDKHLRPDANSPAARRNWQHWYRTFTSYKANVPNVTEENMLSTLFNHGGFYRFRNISDAADFNATIETLQNIYVKRTDDDFARYLIATCRQQPGQSLEEYFQTLK